MKRILLYIAFFSTAMVCSQNDQLAQNYFDKGDFAKAVISYEELLKNQPGNSVYFQRLVESYQQLSQFDKAEKILAERIAKIKQQPNLLVLLGYNHHLQKNDAEAKKHYEQALAKIDENPSYVYGIADAFEKKVLLEYALKAYDKASALDPKMSFNYQTGSIYGQLGNTDMMISRFLDEAQKNQNSNIMIQNQLSRFLTEDSEAMFNDSLKKALLARAQKTQDIFWNQYLSWYFVQLKDYAKAFIQEKAIYRREPETFSNIVNLAELAAEEGDYETAREIFAFVLENTMDAELKVQAHEFLIDLRISKAQPKDYPLIQTEIETRLQEFGISLLRYH